MKTYNLDIKHNKSVKAVCSTWDYSLCQCTTRGVHNTFWIWTAKIQLKKFSYRADRHSSAAQTNYLDIEVAETTDGCSMSLGMISLLLSLHSTHKGTSSDDDIYNSVW